VKPLRALPRLVPQPNDQQHFTGPQLEFYWCRFKIRNGPLLVGFLFLCSGCSKKTGSRTAQSRSHQNP